MGSIKTDMNCISPVLQFHFKGLQTNLNFPGTTIVFSHMVIDSITCNISKY